MRLKLDFVDKNIVSEIKGKIHRFGQNWDCEFIVNVVDNFGASVPFSMIIEKVSGIETIRSLARELYRGSLEKEILKVSVFEDGVWKEVLTSFKSKPNLYNVYHGEVKIGGAVSLKDALGIIEREALGGKWNLILTKKSCRVKQLNREHYDPCNLTFAIKSGAP